MMVNPVSSLFVGTTNAAQSAGVKARATDRGSRAVQPDSVGSAVASLARLGPPVDLNRVSEIRAAIAQGVYTVDADRLAAAMLALDLPVRPA